MITSRIKLRTIFPQCSALLEGVENEPRDDHGRWTTGGGSSGAGDTKASGRVMAKHAETVSQKAHEATKAATGGKGPLAKAAETTHRTAASRGHGMHDYENKEASNEHGQHAKAHEEIAKRVKDPKVKKAHEDAAKLHRAAERAHHNTAHQKLRELGPVDF